MSLVSTRLEEHHIGDQASVFSDALVNSRCLELARTEHPLSQVGAIGSMVLHRRSRPRWTSGYLEAYRSSIVPMDQSRYPLKCIQAMIQVYTQD